MGYNIYGLIMSRLFNLEGISLDIPVAIADGHPYHANDDDDSSTHYPDANQLLRVSVDGANREKYTTIIQLEKNANTSHYGYRW